LRKKKAGKEKPPLNRRGVSGGYAGEESLIISAYFPGLMNSQKRPPWRFASRSHSCSLTQ
jgi:hypothetical protein